jgi:hypothetical protein
MSEDNTAKIKHWLDNGQLAHVSDDLARDWLANDVSVWAVVVNPWLLVQHRPVD